MRALILLLFASILLWGIANFVERGEVEGAERSVAEEVSETPATAEATLGEGRFLAEPPPAAVPAADPADETRGDGDWLGGVTARDVPRDRSALAGAVLHLAPEELREVLRAESEHLSEDEIRLYLAFAEALTGRGREALERARAIADPDSLDPRELAHLKEALGSDAASPIPASAGRRNPVAFAMGLRLTQRAAERALANGDARAAARGFSELLVEELDAPWPADRLFLGRWSEALAEAQGDHRFDPQGDWPALEMEVRPGDSLSLIRVRAIEERPGLLVSTDLIERVNRLGGKYIQPGDVIRVPTDAVRTLVDLSARWVLVFFGEEVAAAYPCGIGAEETPTITGDFTIGTKRTDPPWFRLGREPVPFGDPENPLGTRWLGWVEDAGSRTSYGFHGTWEPDTIGEALSEGCVRFENGAVEELYDLLPRDSTVRVRP